MKRIMRHGFYLLLVFVVACKSAPPKPVQSYSHTIVVRYLNDKLSNDTITATSYRGAPTGSWGAVSMHTWTDDGATASVLHCYGKDKMQMPLQLATGVRSFKVIATIKH